MGDIAINLGDRVLKVKNLETGSQSATMEYLCPYSFMNQFEDWFDWQAGKHMFGGFVKRVERVSFVRSNYFYDNYDVQPKLDEFNRDLGIKEIHLDYFDGSIEILNMAGEVLYYSYLI